MLKWTLQTVTLISVLHASIPVALTETGWLLITPPFHEDLMAALKSYSALIEEPSEEKRQTLLKNLPSPPRRKVLDRLETVFQKMVGEPSLQKRMEIFFESTLNENAPLSNWKQIMAFDSAAECEEQKGELVAKAKDKLGDNEASELTDERIKYIHAVILFRASRCVPASVVYPFKP